MPKRIANVALTLHREGKRVQVKPGDVVTLTKKEIEDFSKLNAYALRLPVNETASEDDEDETASNTNLTQTGQPDSGDMSGMTAQGDSNQANNENVDLDSMTVAELKKYAQDNELEVDLGLNKAELLQAIKTAEANREGDL